MAPLDTWYKWASRHQAGQEVRHGGRLIPMARLLRCWKALGHNAKAERKEFITKHVAPLCRSRHGLASNVRHSLQPPWRSGDDTTAVERRMVIIKRFKTTTKYTSTLEALHKTRYCWCTPAVHGADSLLKQIVQGDVGKTMAELGSPLLSLQKDELIAHLRGAHGMVVHPCQVSPNNICQRSSGLCIIDIAKWTPTG